MSLTRQIIVFVLLALLGTAFYILLAGYLPDEVLNRSALYYAENTAAETGAQNIVAAIIVTYRGLDTLGEVTGAVPHGRHCRPGAGRVQGAQEGGRPRHPAAGRTADHRRAHPGADDPVCSAPMCSSTAT